MKALHWEIANIPSDFKSFIWEETQIYKLAICSLNEQQIPKRCAAPKLLKATNPSKHSLPQSHSRHRGERRSPRYQTALTLLLLRTHKSVALKHLGSSDKHVELGDNIGVGVWGLSEIGWEPSRRTHHCTPGGSKVNAHWQKAVQDPHH